MLQEKFATAPKIEPYHWTGTNVAGCEKWDKRVGKDNYQTYTNMSGTCVWSVGIPLSRSPG